MTIAPFEQIRLYYEFMTPKILEAQKQYIRHWVDPYGGIRWELYFSPIEEMAWMAIRSFGKAPLYPQYPVLKYFIDFANPYVKVAIECDGKEFHQNKEKDYFRDEALFKQGWTIYRISGSDCYKRPSDNYYDLYYIDEENRENVLREFYTYTLEGLLKAIAIFHFDYKGFSLEYNELELAYRTLMDKAFFGKSYLMSKFDKILYEYEYE